MTDDKKKDAFKRIFPPRVEKLIKSLEVLSNCSNKNGYIWDEELIHDVWIQIARIFIETAMGFGVKFKVLVDDTEVEYVPPKKKRSKE